MGAMDKTAYLNALCECLQDVPEGERQEALRFVEEYFQEAGEENQARAAQELGSPQEYARRLKDDLPPVPPLPAIGQRMPDYEKADDPSAFMAKEPVMPSYASFGQASVASLTRGADAQKPTSGRSVAMVLLLLLASPFLLVLCGLAVMLVLLAGMFLLIGLMLLVVLTVSGAAVFVAALVGLFLYIVRAATSVGSELWLAVFFVGLAIACIGLLLMSAALIRSMICKVIPAYVRTCTKGVCTAGRLAAEKWNSFRNEKRGATCV